ncbi:MAG: LAGLIDADG family homing endonuclease, partial [Candidatus Aenigmarchaeota archaeon]|nr:LAGLIDADG family homing endonuclease [Candidatus Aenigmarchaeota archaeon]
MAVAYEVKEGVIRIDARRWAIEPSIEDSEACMGIVVNILKEVKAPEKLIISEVRDREYDYSQLKPLIEIANAQKEILEEKKLLSAERFGPPECEAFFPGRLAELTFIISEVLRKDPIRAYFAISRKIKRIRASLKGATPGYIRCATHYLTNVLEPMEIILSRCQIIATAIPFLPTYRPGDRRIYRELFHPTIRPAFMLTSFKLVVPKEARLLDKYQINKISIEVYRVPGGVRDLYYITAPEFKLSPEKYSILDIAYRTLVARRPPEEIAEPERAREVFFSMGVDLVKDVASRMGIELTPTEIEELARILVRYTAGFGVLELLLGDERIQDVYINSPIGLTPIYIVHSDFEECETNLIPTKEDAEAWTTRFRLYSGRPLDEANPVLDTELIVPRGRARVCVITAPLSPAGLAFSFRRHRERPWTFPLFTKVKMIDPFFAGLMNFIVQGGRSILIAGGRASGKCVDGNTIVFLGNGVISPVKELVSRVFQQEEPVEFERDEIATPKNLQVLTLDKNLKIKTAEVEKVWRRKAPETLVRVKTATGNEVITTKEHPYLTITNGSIKHLKAEELKVGDWVATPRLIPSINSKVNKLTLADLPDELFLEINDDLQQRLNLRKKYLRVKLLKQFINEGKIEEKEIRTSRLKGGTNSSPFKIPLIDKNFMCFLGYLFGDGSISHVSISFHNGNLELRRMFTHLCKEVFGIEAKERFPRARSPKITIENRAIVKLLNKLDIPIGHKAPFIKLSPMLLSTGKEEISSFLSSYFDCDSNISRSCREIELTSSSKEMIGQVKYLLLRFGIVSSTSEKIVSDRKYYRLVIRGENLEIFKRYIGFSHPLKQKRLETLLNKRWKCGIHDTVPNIENIIFELVKKLRIKLSREERKFFKPDVYKRRDWQLTKERLRRFMKLLDNRLKKIAGMENEVNLIKDYKVAISIAEQLMKKISFLVRNSKIGIASIAKVSGLSDKTIKAYLKDRLTDLDNVRKIALSAISLLSVNKRKSDLSEIIVLTEQLNAKDIRESLKNIVETLAIEKKEISSKLGISIASLTYLDRWKVRPRTLLKIIDYVANVWDEINSGEMKEKINFLKILNSSDIFWDEVKEVTEIPSQEPYVYDLTVSGTHNFLANGLVIHNTSLLNALMLEILRKHRLVVIEDTLELSVDLMRKLGYNIERMKTRSVITRIETELPAEEALRTGLRLGESVLIVGEVRGSIRGNEEVIVIENGITKRVKIKDLENKDVRNYNIPTLDFDLKMRIKPLTALVKHTKRDKLIKITTRTGRNVTITPNHSLFTLTRNFKIGAIMCNKLKVGDQVVIPAKMPCGFNDVDELNLLNILPEFRLENFESLVRETIRKIGWKDATKIAGVTSGDIYNYFRAQKTYLPITSFKNLMHTAKINYSKKELLIRKGTSKKLSAIIPIDEDFCRFLGYYVSEGYYDLRPKCGGNVVITNSNEKLISDIIKVGKKIFGLKPSIRLTRGLGKSKQMKLSCLPLASLISKLECGRISEEKRIPPIIFGLSKKKIAEFLKGLYSGDGCFEK